MPLWFFGPLALYVASQFLPGKRTGGKVENGLEKDRRSGRNFGNHDDRDLPGGDPANAPPGSVEPTPEPDTVPTPVPVPAKVTAPVVSL